MLLAIGLVLWSAAGAQPVQQYRVKHDGVDAVLVAGTKRASYRVRMTGADTPEKQFAALDELLKSVWSAGSKPDQFSFGLTPYREPLDYLASKTACNPPKGPLGEHLLQLLAGGEGHTMLSRFFGERGYAVKVTGIEQILTTRCKPPACTANCAGAAKRMVPSSAIITYEITRQ